MSRRLHMLPSVRSRAAVRRFFLAMALVSAAPQLPLALRLILEREPKSLVLLAHLLAVRRHGAAEVVLFQRKTIVRQAAQKDVESLLVLIFFSNSLMLTLMPMQYYDKLPRFDFRMA